MKIIYDPNKLQLNNFNHNIFTILMYKNAYLKDLRFKIEFLVQIDGQE